MKLKQLLIGIPIIDLIATIIYTFILWHKKLEPTLSSAFLSALGISLVIISVIGGVIVGCFLITGQLHYNKPKEITEPHPETFDQQLPHLYFNPLKTDYLPNPNQPTLDPKTTVNAFAVTKVTHNNITGQATKNLILNKVVPAAINTHIIGLIDEDHKTQYFSLNPDLYNHNINKWSRTHCDNFKAVIYVIKQAIAMGKKSIVIHYNYDGVWAYAAGYWSTKDDIQAQKYVESFEELTPHINIYFQKFEPSTFAKELWPLVEKVNAL